MKCKNCGYKLEEIDRELIHGFSYYVSTDKCTNPEPEESSE